jgi:hypothetical protein
MSGIEFSEHAVTQHLFLEAFMIAPEGMESATILRHAAELDHLATTYGPARLREAAWEFRCRQLMRAGELPPVELPPWLRSFALPSPVAATRSPYGVRARQARAAVEEQRRRGPVQPDPGARTWNDFIVEHRQGW